jgi:hypothetical protein
MSASTSHRTTVFVALSSEPFSTMKSITSPRPTSTKDSPASGLSSMSEAK